MRRVVMVACAALLFLPVAIKSRKNQDIPALTAFNPLSSSKISVKVSGDVLHAGIYQLAANSLAGTVIKMAEPLCSLKQNKYDADTVVQPLLDGSTVNFTILADGSPLVMVGQMTVPERLILGIPLDISTMTGTDFDRLPGIGPSLARSIVEYRQRNGGSLSLSDLSKVEGMGDKKCKMVIPFFQRP